MRLGLSASQQASGCADVARCTNRAMYDVFGNGVHVIYYEIGCNTTQRGQGQVLLGRLVTVLMLMLLSTRQILMLQGAPTVQCMMYSAMVFSECR